MSFPNCPTCGDVLHQSECPRCDWGGWNTFDDATKNPQDPTVDFHRGIQSAWEDEPSWNRENLPWSPGVEGKGWLGQNGVYTWRIDDRRRPFHMYQRGKAEKEIGQLDRGFYIRPDGEVWDLPGRREPFTPEELDFIQSHDPRLHGATNDPDEFQLTSQRWYVDHEVGGGMAHEQL